MKDIMRIVKSLDDTGLLIKGVGVILHVNEQLEWDRIFDTISFLN